VDNRTGAEVDILEVGVTDLVGTSGTVIGTAAPGVATFHVAPKPGVSYWARLQGNVVGAESGEWLVPFSRSCLPD
jgi:hypothetical protein